MKILNTTVIDSEYVWSIKPGVLSGVHASFGNSTSGCVANNP